MMTTVNLLNYRFLFEGDQGTVIYTGDFRLNRTDLQAMSALHSLSRFTFSTFKCVAK